MSVQNDDKETTAIDSNRPHRSSANHHRALALLTGLVAVAAMASSAPVFAGLFSSTPAPSFQIAAPAAAANVHSPVAIKVLVHGATIGRPEDGLDHLHIAVDGGEATPVYQMPVSPLTLAPGPHTVMVELAGPDHMPLIAPKTVTFTVVP